MFGHESNQLKPRELSAQASRQKTHRYSCRGKRLPGDGSVLRIWRPSSPGDARPFADRLLRVAQVGGETMKIYVASSWRNPLQPAIVHTLRRCGHDVYDFRSPKPGDRGFHWSELGHPGYKRGELVDPKSYREMLQH